MKLHRSHHSNPILFADPGGAMPGYYGVISITEEEGYTVTHYGEETRLANSVGDAGMGASNAAGLGGDSDNPVRDVDPDGRATDDPPLNIMKIRRNRASNLGPGYVRTNGTVWHAGHDLYAPVGTAVMSVLNGKVIKVGYSNSYGNYITIEHDVIVNHSYTSSDGTEYNWTTTVKRYSFYAHLNSTSVSEGDTVETGQIIGEVGTTGNAISGVDGGDEHLHFEWGSELRGNGRKMLKKSSLRNPNEAYKTVKFESQDPNATNQTNIGIIKTEYNEFKGHKYESKFYYNVNEE